MSGILKVTREMAIGTARSVVITIQKAVRVQQKKAVRVIVGVRWT